MKNKALIASVLTIALCLSLVVGSTFALFTSESTVNINVSVGTVKVDAEIVEGSVKVLQMASGGTMAVTDTTSSDSSSDSPSDSTSATVNNGVLSLSGMQRGTRVSFKIKVTNSSTVTAKYRFETAVTNNGLFEYLKLTVDGDVIKDVDDTPSTASAYSLTPTAAIGTPETTAAVTTVPAGYCTEWTTIQPALTEAEKSFIVPIVIEVPNSVTADISGSCTIAFTAVATQGNDPYIYNNDPAHRYNIKSADDLMTLSGKTLTDAPVIVFESDIDMKDYTWVPFSHTGGVFINGNGYTISNLSAPLISTTGGKTTIQWLTIKNSTMEQQATAEGSGFGAFIGSAGGEVILRNCYLKDCKLTAAGNSAVGGLVGSIKNGRLYARNCRVESGCELKGGATVGGLVGSISFDSTAGTADVVNCYVANTTLTSSAGESWCVGVFVGTLDRVSMTVTKANTPGSFISANNTLSQTSAEAGPVSAPVSEPICGCTKNEGALTIVDAE